MQEANNTDTTDAYTMNIGDQLTGRVKKIRAEECLWDSETGYSPQNTNTPSRFGQLNVANLNSPYGCSLSDLQPSPPNDPEITFSDMGGGWHWFR
ncbi:hypothetical protein LLG10_06925 [bacterium]|nr:hypothetical protein [bacterium]